MWSNLLIGLLIPGVIIGYLFRKKPALVILMYPLGVAIGFVGSDWGFELFWKVSPTYENNSSISAFPYKIGYFPLLTSLFGYIRTKEIIKTPLLIFLFTISTTFLEFLAVWSGKIHYFNGWNIFLTFFIYLAGFIGAFFYIKMLKKYKILV
ncbi:hypothetical protein [Halobacillus sp. BBL2006]|uniref:hypothetical protein n=1 Tax=Halobacillus sp. BBL2006 TaxID=1543706 RepID=UPI0005426BCB|nr:hypothetical protein [Halobacillus sp. BBL2006]KHE67702.1 hypothetical protein LD39_16425 [Halobacillus sp. BBL2006]